jgi:hypothetical protein
MDRGRVVLFLFIIVVAAVVIVAGVLAQQGAFTSPTPVPSPTVAVLAPATRTPAPPVARRPSWRKVNRNDGACPSLVRRRHRQLLRASADIMADRRAERLPAWRWSPSGWTAASTTFPKMPRRRLTFRPVGLL